MKFQIGKSGVTEGVLESLTNAFKTHKIIRISVLKNSVRDREKIKEFGDDLVKRLPGNYRYKIIGFVIVLRRIGKTAGK